MSFESYDLQLANRILSSIRSKSFMSVVTKAERGYGKSMYNYKAMAYVYWNLLECSEDEAWSKALDNIIFTPNELMKIVDYNIDNDFISPVICIDDATVHFSSYLHFINLFQAALLNATFDTIRTVTNALLINCPDKSRLLPALRKYDDYEATIYKDISGSYNRKVVCIKWYKLPDGKRKYRKSWEDYFSCYIPNKYYQRYYNKRKMYSKEINEKLQELRIKLEKKQNKKTIKFINE